MFTGRGAGVDDVQYSTVHSTCYIVVICILYISDNCTWNENQINIPGCGRTQWLEFFWWKEFYENLFTCSLIINSMRERCSKKQNYWTCQGNKGVRAYLFGSKHVVGKIKTQHQTTTIQCWWLSERYLKLWLDGCVCRYV